MGYQGDGTASDEQFLVIWRNALEKYKTQTSHDLTKLEKFQMGRIESVDDLSRTMLAIEEHFKSSRDGKPGYRKTRDVLKSCVVPLQALCSVASTAISATPLAPAATVFGAGMYLIEACESVSKAYDFVTELLEECKTYIDRLAKYTEISVDHKFLLKLTAILKFVLEVFGECEQVMAGTRLKHWMHALIGQRKDEILKSSLDRLKRYFNEEEMYVIAQVYVTGQKTESNVSKLMDFNKIDRVQKIIDTLPVGPFDLAAKQAEYNAKSNASPPDWVYDNEAYQAWINGTLPHHRWLWGLGDVGVGKTSIVSYLTGNWKTHVKLSPRQGGKVHLIDSLPGDEGSHHALHQRAVALFYGDYETKGEQRPDYVFQCLIRQLLQQLLSAAVDRAAAHCEKIENLKNSAEESTSFGWTSVLDNLASEFQEAFIVVDALDKDESGYEALISNLDQLTSPNLKLLVTSRDELSMREDAIFRKAMPMTVGADVELVKSYVWKRLTRIQSHDETTEAIGTSALPEVLADPSLLARIVDVVVSNSSGNFYYAEAQINSLMRERTQQNVQKKLKVLKESLSDVIRLDVERVREQRDAYKREVGLKAVMLTSFAQRPLSIGETRHAVALLLHTATCGNPQAHESKVEELTTEFLVECSCQLLKIDHQTAKVDIDDSIKSFCNRSDMFNHAHYKIAEICLNFLDWMSFPLRCKSKEEYIARTQQYPFYGYAARFWGFHLGEAGESMFLGTSAPVSLLTLLKRRLFLNAVAAALHEDLIPRMWNWAGHDTWKSLQDAKEPVLWPMHLLTYFDLPRTADWWLRQNPHDVERKSATGTTPLFLACRLGRVRIVEILLFDYHADPALMGSPPSAYALSAAVIAQSRDVVERLLFVKSKELLQASNRHGRRPLGEAMRGEDLNIVRILIEACQMAPNGEHILTSGDADGWTALHEAAAAPNPSLEAMKLLVRANGGRKLLQQKTVKWEDSALHLAARRGQHGAVQILLELGADPTMRQILGKTPLMLAVEGLFDQNERCIRVLMEWTEDHRLQDNAGNTTWHLAAIHGRPNILALLIQLTPESLFNVPCKNGMTPIRTAAIHRRPGWRLCIMVLLRDCPGELSTEDADAILETLVSDHHENSLKALKMLLEHPIEPWPFCRGNTTVLHKAVLHGSIETARMVWTLLGSKRMLEHHDADGSTTPLVLAAKISAVDKALLLLEEGADPNSRDNTGRTALHHAVERDLPDLVAALFDKGADYHIKDNDGFTALERVAITSSCAQLSQVIVSKRTLM